MISSTRLLASLRTVVPDREEFFQQLSFFESDFYESQFCTGSKSAIVVNPLSLHLPAKAPTQPNGFPAVAKNARPVDYESYGRVYVCNHAAGDRRCKLLRPESPSRRHFVKE